MSNSIILTGKSVEIYDLKQLIKFYGYKIYQIEKKLNLSSGYFNRTTNNNITFEVIYKLSILFNLPLETFSKLLFGDEKNES